jgi:hypothetical protein
MMQRLPVALVRLCKGCRRIAIVLVADVSYKVLPLAAKQKALRNKALKY